MECGSTREKLSARKRRRVRTLLLLDSGPSVRATAIAVGGYPREVSRVGNRYLARGLEAALTDDARPDPPKKLDSTQEAAVIAMVCGPAPEGHARWTVRLVAGYAVKKVPVRRFRAAGVRIRLIRGRQVVGGTSSPAA
jgi:hypothetical protein